MVKLANEIIARVRKLRELANVSGLTGCFNNSQE